MYKRLVFLSSFLLTGMLFQSYIAQSAYADTTSSLYPTADGKYTQWSVHNSTNHFANVDDNPCNGTTDYNFTTTHNNRDSYKLDLSSVPNYSTITGISITPCASQNSGGGSPSTLNVFYVWNNSDSSDVGSYSLSGTTPTVLSATAFNSLNLLKTPTSTLESGAVYSAGTKGARLSNIATVITYTLPNPPSAPSNLVATNATSTSNNLTWSDNSSNEDGLKVDRSLNGTNNFSTVATLSANTTSYSDTGLSTNQTYYYRVYAYNAGGNSSYSNTSYAITATAAPTAPSNVVATNSGATTNIVSWQDNSTNEDSFVIERSVNGISNFTFLASTSANTTSYTDIGLTSDQTYYYHVYAKNAVGRSANSNYSYAITETVVPNDPSNLTANATASALLNWTDNSTNEEQFSIERSTDDINFVQINTVTLNTTTYTDSNVVSGTTYYYRVRAHNSIGYSGYTNEASVTIP